jgi:DNA-binding response OmpR family regulator
VLPPLTNRKVVLIVEDSPDLADLIRTAIVSEVGCYALVAQDAHHALRYLHSIKPSLIILDVNLPGTNGLDLYDILQGNEKLSNTPVLFLTAAADDAQFRARHFPHVLAKPFHLNNLLTQVSALCSQPAGA